MTLPDPVRDKWFESPGVTLNPTQDNHAVSPDEDIVSRETLSMLPICCNSVATMTAPRSSKPGVVSGVIGATLFLAITSNM